MALVLFIANCVPFIAYFIPSKNVPSIAHCVPSIANFVPSIAHCVPPIAHFLPSIAHAVSLQAVLLHQKLQ